MHIHSRLEIKKLSENILKPILTLYIFLSKLSPSPQWRTATRSGMTSGRFGLCWNYIYFMFKITKLSIIPSWNNKSWVISQQMVNARRQIPPGQSIVESEILLILWLWTFDITGARKFANCERTMCHFHKVQCIIDRMVRKARQHCEQIIKLIIFDTNTGNLSINSISRSKISIRILSIGTPHIEKPVPRTEI